MQNIKLSYLFHLLSRQSDFLRNFSICFKDRILSSQALGFAKKIQISFPASMNCVSFEAEPRWLRRRDYILRCLLR